MGKENNFDCSCGSTFILNGHLWVVITPPTKISKQVIIVFLTTCKSYSDTTVILNQEDHKFIKHTTAVSFAEARILTQEDIMQRLKMRAIEPRENFDADKVEELQKGLLESDRTPQDIKDFFVENYSN